MMNPNLNPDNLDNNNQDPTNMSDDDKKSYMLTYVRTFRINSNTDVFERLLSSGVSPNITGPEGKSLLMIACEKGSIELVQALLDAGADVEQRDRHGKTALFYAVEVANENSDVISLLLSQKADPTAKSYEGKTPLIRAVEKGHCNIAKTLLSRGGNIYVTVESSGDTLLHLAAKQEDASMVQMLLAHNADPNRKNKRNQLALDVCQNGGHVMQIIQSVYPRQKPPAPTPDPQANANQQVNINAQIHEFLQIQSLQQNQQYEHQGKQNDEQAQFRQDNMQGQDQNADGSKGQQKQPLQDYRRHQQQQQINQKKSPQHVPQKVEKEPPTRKYPGKTDTSMRRTVSNNEASTREGGMADSNSSINRTNENMTTSGNVLTNNYTLEVPQHPYEPNQNYGMNPGMDSQGEDMPVQQVPPGYGHRPHEHGKSPEHTNQYQYQNRQQQQQLNKKMNIPGGASSASEISSTSTSTTERFQQERDIQPNLIKTPQGEFMQQFHPQQQQQQGQQQMQAAYMGNPPQMGQMGFNPVQMKGNVSPNMYANPQFFNASPNPNSNQPYQKRKPKGQIAMPPNANNKNFPMNPNQNNQNNPNVVVQNQPPMGQNQYNRGGNMPPNMEGGRPDQGFQQQPQSQRGPGNQQGGNKYNKNAERNYQDNNMQQQQPRGFVSPKGYQQHPNMNPNMNMPGNTPPEVGDVQKMPGEGIVKMPVSARGVEEGGKEQKGGRPQQQQYHHQQQQQQQGQQQGNMMFGNNSGGMMFGPNFIMDPRMMASNMPGQNQMMFNTNFPQGQQGNINMMNNQNMPQNNFINYSPSMTPSRGQQMMPKGQIMQSPFNYANGAQMNTSMDPKVVHLNMNDPLQADNMKLSANVHSMLKGINDQMLEIDKTKNDNKELRVNLDDMQQNEKALQEKLREKERLIEELKKKTEDLELTAKTISSKAPLVNRQDSSVITDGLLDNFISTPFEKILQEPKPKPDFWKHDDLVTALHEEVLAFEKSVDNYNTEKKNLFDSLITMIRQTVAEVVTETEFYIYGSFATGLSLPWSDIDIVIKIPQLFYNGYAAILDSIEQNLKKKKWVDDIKIIKNTSVPVLKITCSKSTYTSKKVDISLQDTRHNGLACVELVREYLTFYPALRPLVLILKQFLYRLNLNDTYSGGLSSYGLILMVVYLFQTRELQNSMNPVENQNLGSLLLSFLYFYGFEFDYYNQFLVNPKKIPKGNEITDPFAENMSVINLVNQNPPSIMEPKIIIQDPLSLANNVGRSTFQIKQIKNAFMAAYFEAHKPCICEVHKFIGEIDSFDGKKPVHKCASIFRRMMLSLQPLK